MCTTTREEHQCTTCRRPFFFEEVSTKCAHAEVYNLSHGMCPLGLRIITTYKRGECSNCQEQRLRQENYKRSRSMGSMAAWVATWRLVGSLHSMKWRVSCIIPFKILLITYRHMRWITHAWYEEWNKTGFRHPAVEAKVRHQNKWMSLSVALKPESHKLLFENNRDFGHLASQFPKQ